MNARDTRIAAVIATVMQVEANDPRLPIVLDIVRSMDALDRREDRARAGAIGGKQKASKRLAKPWQTPSKRLANDSLLEDVSSGNHEGNTAAQAEVSPAPPLGDLFSAPSLSPPDSGSSLSNPGDLQFHERADTACAYCGVKQRQSPWGFEVDHFVPQSAGGVPWGVNMVPACHTCNQIKKHRVFVSLEAARAHIHHTLWRTNRAKYRKARELCFGGRQPTGDPPPSVRITPDWPGFDVFWTAYPRKEAKPSAKRMWDKATPPLDAVLAALAWQVLTEQWRKEAGKFIPHPASYLHARRWEDERPRTPPLPPMSDRERGNRQALSAFVAKGGKLL